MLHQQRLLSKEDLKALTVGLNALAKGHADGKWDIGLEAARRFAVQMYLFSIALGLATIIYVVRFQSIRIREIADAG